jgi:hypothetical protein
MSTSRVSGFTWFDDHGHRQSASGQLNDTMTMDSFNEHYTVILRTDGPGRTFRYSAGDWWVCPDPC